MEVPPRRVLDIGCGGGIWILAAAQHWTDCSFVGLDISRRQPDLVRTRRDDLSNRVKWVQANFLDGLPFPNSDFDFVRIQNVGLGVPEDEWQYLIDEVVRILKPGGTFEIIEEDISFPSPDTPSSSTPKQSPTLRSRFSRSLSRSTATGFMILDDDLEEFELDPDRSSDRGSKGRSLDTISERRSDPRDHSKLKEAFFQLLSSRFINPQVNTVLPFYLQASFTEVQSYPIMKLYIPPPSGVTYNPPEISDDASHFSVASSDTLVNSASTSPTCVRRLSNASATSASAADSAELVRARFHLSKILATMRSCKELIWHEYERLHWHDRTVPNVRLDRDDFEMLFYNWECDMEDRIGMRNELRSSLGWSVPPLLTKADWQDWREKSDKDSNADIHAFYSTAPPESLRSVRGYICKKPTSSPPRTNGHSHYSVIM